MADLLKAIRAKLLTASGVTDKVSTRIYPLHAEQNATLPYVVLKEVGSDAVEHLKGTSGVSSTRVQFDCTASTYAAAYALRESVRQAVHAWLGTSDGLRFMASVQGSRYALYLEPREGSDQGKYVSIIDIVFTHTEVEITS